MILPAAVTENVLHHVAGMTIKVHDRRRRRLSPIRNSVLLVGTECRHIEYRVTAAGMRQLELVGIRADHLGYRKGAKPLGA